MFGFFNIFVIPLIMKKTIIMYVYDHTEKHMPM